MEVLLYILCKRAMILNKMKISRIIKGVHDILRATQDFVFEFGSVIAQSYLNEISEGRNF